jgi:hypothetical protein
MAPLEAGKEDEDEDDDKELRSIGSRHNPVEHIHDENSPSIRFTSGACCARSRKLLQSPAPLRL